MKAFYALFLLLAASANITRAQQPTPQPSATEEKWVCVVGSVISPSRIAFKSGLTVTEAIKQAGGILPDNKINKVYVYSRTTDDLNRMIQLDLKTLKKKPYSDVALQSYDIIEVVGKKSGRDIQPSLKPCILSPRL